MRISDEGRLPEASPVVRTRSRLTGDAGKFQSQLIHDPSVTLLLQIALQLQ
jgi:hypothetical protein